MPPPVMELGGSKDLPFPFQCIIFQKWQMFDVPTSTPGGYASTEFFAVNLILDNFC